MIERGHEFPATRWTLVLRVGEPEAGDEARRALEELCKIYWYPLYAFARRQGLGAHDAQDATQGFFANLLRREDLSRVEPARAAFLAVLMFSLAGVPPLVGFFGKFYVLMAAVNAGMTWLAVAGVIASVIGAYY